MKLLIAKANQLGDNVVFLPVIQELIRRAGSENIHVLTSPVAADLYRDLLPQRNLWVEPTSEILGAWKNPAFFLKLWKRWRKIAPDAALLPFDQGNVPRMLARLTGTPFRVGARNGLVRTNWCLTEMIEPDLRKSLSRLEWETGRQFARLLGLARNSNPWPERPPRPDFSHLTGRDPEVRDRILIHAGASDSVKCWPVENFVELANRLSRHYEVCWTDLGEPEEKHLGPFVNRLPKSCLSEFVRVVAESRMFIGNNSGPMHLASAAGVPTVIFAGPAPKQWDPPWNRGHNAILRSPSLDCQPCATVECGVEICLNREEPGACMNRWPVDRVEKVVHNHWERCGNLQPRQSGIAPASLR